MKIINRTAFLAMPDGTVFSKYEPCVFGELLIKGKSLDGGSGDFCYQSIVDAIASTGSGDFGDKLFDAEENGTSLPMDFDCQGRDGTFEMDQLFAVFEPRDVRQLIERLEQALSDQMRGAGDE